VGVRGRAVGRPAGWRPTYCDLRTGSTQLRAQCAEASRYFEGLRQEVKLEGLLVYAAGKLLHPEVTADVVVFSRAADHR